MKSYKDVKAQIEKLQREAESLRHKELKSVIAQVRKLIEQYELTPADLGLAGGAVRKRGRKAASTGSRGRVSVGVAKYRDPATGKTWTGRGRPPTWMIGVKDPSAYLIDGASAAAPAKPAKPAKKAAAKKKRAAPARKARAPKAAAKAAKAPKAAKKVVSRKRAAGKGGGKNAGATTEAAAPAA